MTDKEIMMVEFLKAMLINSTLVIRHAPNIHVQLARDLADRVIKEAK